jgi:hypothetical protein
MGDHAMCGSRDFSPTWYYIIKENIQTPMKAYF